MPRFLHIADWQIGRTYRFFEPDDAAALAEARINSVKRLAALTPEPLLLTEQLVAILQKGMARHRTMVCNPSERHLQLTDNERHQILLFSCQPKNWQELGAKVCEIEQLG